MRTLKSLIVVCIALLSISTTVAQSGWIGALPMQFNPSFAGATGNARIATSIVYLNEDGYLTDNINHRNIPLKATTPYYSFSFDNFIPAIASGVGFTASYSTIHHQYDTTIFNSDYFYSALSWSPKISIAGKYTLAPSIGVAYYNSSFKRISGRPTFGYDYYYSANPMYNAHKYNPFSYQAGILFNTEKYYVGVTAYTSGMTPTMYTQDYRLVASGGYTYKRRPQSKMSVTLQLAAEYSIPHGPMGSYADLNQGFSVRQIALGLNYKKLLLGIGGGSPFGPSAMVGYQSDKVKVMYIQHEIGGDTYSAELSFRYNFGPKGGGKTATPASNKM